MLNAGTSPPVGNCSVTGMAHSLGFSFRKSANQRNLDEVRLLKKELEKRTRSFRPPIQLSFRFPPHHDSPEPLAGKPEDPNNLLEQRTLALRDDAVNRPIVEFEKWIKSSSGKLSRVSPAHDEELDATTSDLQLQLESQSEALRNLIRQNWYHQRERAVAEFEIAKLKRPTRSVVFDCSESSDDVLGYVICN